MKERVYPISFFWLVVTFYVMAK